MHHFRCFLHDTPYIVLISMYDSRYRNNRDGDAFAHVVVVNIPIIDADIKHKRCALSMRIYCSSSRWIRGVQMTTKV
jgi:hypothetical protein